MAIPRSPDTALMYPDTSDVDKLDLKQKPLLGDESMSR